MIANLHLHANYIRETSNCKIVTQNDALNKSHSDSFFFNVRSKNP